MQPEDLAALFSAAASTVAAVVSSVSSLPAQDRTEAKGQSPGGEAKANTEAGGGDMYDTLDGEEVSYDHPSQTTGAYSDTPPLPKGDSLLQAATVLKMEQDLL